MRSAVDPVMPPESIEVRGPRADWVVDLGPGAGHDGGRVVFEGTPADLLDASGSSPAGTCATASCKGCSAR